MDKPVDTVELRKVSDYAMCWLNARDVVAIADELEAARARIQELELENQRLQAVLNG